MIEFRHDYCFSGSTFNKDNPKGFYSFIGWQTFEAISKLAHDGVIEVRKISGTLSKTEYIYELLSRLNILPVS